MKILKLLAPFFIAIYPVLFLFNQNIEELWLKDIWVGLVVILTVNVFLFFGVHYLIKDTIKTLLIITFFWICFYTYSFLFDHTITVVLNNVFIYYLVIFLLFLLSLKNSWRLLKTKKSIRNIKQNFVITVLLVSAYIMHVFILDFSTSIYNSLVVIAFTPLFLFALFLAFNKLVLIIGNEKKVLKATTTLLYSAILYILIYQSELIEVSHRILFLGFIVIQILALLISYYAKDIWLYIVYAFIISFSFLILGLEIKILWYNFISELIWLFLFLKLFFLIKNSKHKFQKVYTIITVSVTVLFIFPFVYILKYEYNYMLEKKVINKTIEERQFFYENVKTSINDTPDIYYIILDEYASSQAIAHLFEFDNTPFEDALRERGCYVDTWTTVSDFTTDVLSSVFNMEKVSYDGSWRKNALIIQNNTIVNILKKNNFYLATLPVFRYENKVKFDIVDYFYVQERTCFNSLVGDFYSFLLFKTPLHRFVVPQADYYRNSQSLYFYKTPLLKKQLADSMPFFIYTHILSPHLPYVFDSIGNNIGLQTDGTKYYLGQYIYTNKRVLDLIDNIKLDNPNSVIIIQSDHGPRNNVGNLSVEKDFTSQIINIMYFPDQNYAELEKAHKYNVNTFRVVLNKYFGADLPYLTP